MYLCRAGNAPGDRRQPAVSAAAAVTMALSVLLFQDHDVLMLFHARPSGIEEPEDPVNRRMGMSGLSEAAWLDPFDLGSGVGPVAGAEDQPVAVRIFDAGAPGVPVRVTSLHALAAMGFQT